MTVQKDVTKNIYVGNGSTRTFPFTFECPAEHPEYIKVYLMQDDGTALATSDYQLDMDARQITYPSSGTALPEGKKLVIMRELPLQQMMNLVNNGPYFAEDVELAFDENVMAMQQIAEKLNRSIIMSVDIDGDAFVNEVPFEAGKSFRIADDGKSIVLTEDPARVLPTVQNLATAAETSAKQARFNAESAANHVIAAERESRNAEKYAKKAKDISENVNVFVPAVDAGGTLTWTNKAGLANPAAVNIKGPQGVQGKKGDPGTGITIKGKYDSLSALQAAHPKADEGDAYMAGTNLYVWNGSAWIDCGNVQGPKGDKGDTGSKGDAFTYADFTQEQLASLKGPKGDKGDTGAKGSTGATGAQGPQGPQGVQGLQGPAGNAATITIGSVTTSAPGTSAQVTNSGTSSAAVLDFVLPKGKDGADGGVTVDEALSDTSTNPLQNRAVKAALDKRAVLDDTNTFTSPNTFDIIYMQKNVGSIRWYEGSQSVVTGHINATSYTGEANTAKKASKDGDGNVITDTYATKTELNSCVKTVNNVAPDASGNVSITVSGGGSNITVDDTLSITSTNPIQNKAVALKFGEFTEAFNTKANIVDLADVATSGQYYDLKNTPTVDTTLSSTSTNAIQNKAVYNALLNKVGTDIYSGFALIGATSTIAWRQGTQPVGSINASNYTGNAASATKATQDGAGNVITDTYAKKTDVSGMVKSVNNTKPDSNGNVNITVSGGSDITVDDTLSSTSTNAIQNKAVYNALKDKLGKNDNVATATRALQDVQGNIISSTYIKFINGVGPDTSGNVNVSAGGGGVSTSVANNWSAQQNFQSLKFSFESFATSRISGTYDSPATSVATYNVTGALTLDMSTLTGMLANGEATLFTAYIASNASYALSITNAGTLKYVGSAADLAITSSGLLLNVLLTKNASGAVTSIAQASKLS